MAGGYIACDVPLAEVVLRQFIDLFEACHPSPEAPGQILVVDDNFDNRNILMTECEGHPFVLHFAITGEEALSLCAARRFEGILLDVNLPDMTGIELCQHMGQLSNSARTPKIFLSANAKGMEWHLIGLAAGAMDYLTWPYAPLELLAKLRVMVRLARQQELLVAFERTRALLEVSGGAAHELSQPLTSAQLLLDRWIDNETLPGLQGLTQLQGLLNRAVGILHQLRGLNDYASMPYPGGPVLDLKASVKANS